MTTWREAIAAKRERQRREKRFYTRDKLGRVCTECGIRMPMALVEAGENTHATCDPESRRIMGGRT